MKGESRAQWNDAHNKARAFLEKEGVTLKHISQEDLPQYAGGLYVAVPTKDFQGPTFEVAGQRCLYQHSYPSDCAMGAWRVLTGAAWDAWP